MNHRPSLSRAFTLIELLIVVAIIGILAAIAVPNFLEAQTRAKVTRVKADLKSISTALGAYSVDNNRFPPVASSFALEFTQRLSPLTTPVAYMTEVPRDVFVRERGPFAGLGSVEDATGDHYIYNTGNITFGTGVSVNQPRAWSYSLASAGPDRQLEWPYYAWAENFTFNKVYLDTIYDPTNGTVSRGEIFRRGGSFTPLPGADRD